MKARSGGVCKQKLSIGITSDARCMLGYHLLIKFVLYAGICTP
jgi:hypothetical protein